MYVAGTNKFVNKINSKRLEKLPGILIEYTAQVSTPTRGLIDPQVDNKGDIQGAPFQKYLKLKLNCRVMMTYNVDVCDSLTNGTLGEVVGFKYDKSDKLKYILVKFDEAECGRERRKHFGNNDYITQMITPVDIFEFNFPYSRSKHANSSSVKPHACSFP